MGELTIMKSNAKRAPRLKLGKNLLIEFEPAELAWQEISESRSALEKILGLEVWAFGFPFGNAATMTQREIRLAEQAGFRCAFLNIGGGFGAKFERFAIPRVHVTAEMTVPEFEAHITGFYRSLRQRLLGAKEETISA